MMMHPLTRTRLTRRALLRAGLGAAAAAAAIVGGLVALRERRVVDEETAAPSP